MMKADTFESWVVVLSTIMAMAVLLFVAYMAGQNYVIGKCATNGKFTTETTVLHCYTQQNTTNNGELNTQSSRRNK